MEELLKILNEIKPGVNFLEETDLIEDGIFDSIEIMELAEEIMDVFEIDLTPVDIVPENFKTLQTIYEMIEKLKEE